MANMKTGEKVSYQVLFVRFCATKGGSAARFGEAVPTKVVKRSLVVREVVLMTGLIDPTKEGSAVLPRRGLGGSNRYAHLVRLRSRRPDLTVGRRAGRRPCGLRARRAGRVFAAGRLDRLEAGKSTDAVGPSEERWYRCRLQISRRRGLRSDRSATIYRRGGQATSRRLVEALLPIYPVEPGPTLERPSGEVMGFVAPPGVTPGAGRLNPDRGSRGAVVGIVGAGVARCAVSGVACRVGALGLLGDRGDGIRIDHHHHRVAGSPWRAP